MSHEADRDSVDREGDVSRRRFLQVAGGVVVGNTLSGQRFASAQSERTQMKVDFDGDVATATITQLQAGMETDELTCLSITQARLRRIDELDRREPAINSVLMTNPEALDLAARLDRERRETGSRGALHGIPIL